MLKLIAAEDPKTHNILSTTMLDKLLSKCNRIHITSYLHFTVMYYGTTKCRVTYYSLHYFFVTFKRMAK